jgi:iron complex outermembrane recepter protein
MCFGSCADSSFRGALLVCAHPHCEGRNVWEQGNRAVAVTYRARRVVRAIAIVIVLASTALPAWPQQKAADLTAQSLEDLMNIEVTSVSKTQETLSHTAAAVFVISPEDISRSGATSIPDLLRAVPGMDVSQINGNTWAISVRGFNARFSNDLLVLVDGRPVYTETFGGVYWDVLDLPLENVERIEVIRGPGGSVWGANAVNGVVNIITKKASESHGGLVVAGGGNTDQGFGITQYGGHAGDKTDYRVYAKYLNQDHSRDSTGQDGGDGWHMLRGGFRVDSVVSSKDTLMFEGNIYSAREGLPTISFPSVTASAPQNIEQLANLSGGFIQGLWDHTYSSHSDTTLQVSYDRYEREDILREGRDTLNVDFQHHFSGWVRQSIVWGLTYRYSSWNSDGNLTASFAPADLNTQLFGSFIQDEIAVVPDRVYLTIGTKLEHNHYTGFALMPSARVAWAPNPHHTLWAAVSQADRTPSALDASARSTISGFPGPGGIPVLVTFIGNPQVKNEGLIAYEMGYRTTVLKQLSIDFTTYFNNYSDQYTSEPSTPFVENTPPPQHIVQPITFANLMHGETHGIEVAVNWQPTRRWTLSPGYAFEEIHMRLAPTSQDTNSVGEAEGSSPEHSAQLRSHLTLPHGLSWDTSAYFVGRLTDPREPSYTRLDTQLTWLVGEGASLSFVGQNLVKNLHEEFVDLSGSARTTLVKRSAYAKFTWRF